MARGGGAMPCSRFLAISEQRWARPLPKTVKAAFAGGAMRQAAASGGAKARSLVVKDSACIVMLPPFRLLPSVYTQLRDRHISVEQIIEKLGNCVPLRPQGKEFVVTAKLLVGEDD